VSEQLTSVGVDYGAPCVLALDIGTSSVRALLYDASGAAIPGAQAHHTYDLTLGDDGEHSVDADRLVALVADCIDEVLAGAGAQAARIAAVATDTFWHSLVAVDAGGRALMPVMTWADVRPGAAAQILRSQLDGAAIHHKTGARLHASYWPAKLRWLATAQPDVFQRAARFLSFGEYLHRTFLGRAVCGLCMASGTGLLDLRARTWDAPLATAVGVRLEQLPPLGDLRDAVRGLRADYAARWPALRDVPWYPALGDGATANVGSGCASAGQIALTVGTSSAMRTIVPVEQVTLPDGLWLYLLDARRGVLGGALSEGGNLLAWLEQTLRLSDLVNAEAAAAQLAPDEHGLTILPFIAGERSLGWHDSAHATVAGLTLKTTPADLLCASLEALAYRLGAVYGQLAAALHGGTAPVVVGSGGTLLGSPLFQQVLADTLGVPLAPLREHEASARGAALLALEALGALADAAAAPAQLDAPLLPDAARGAIYRQAAARQQRLYQKLLDESAV
jgi:gluconokinase